METVESVLKGEKPFDVINANHFESLVAYFVSRGCEEKSAHHKASLLCIAIKRDWLEILSLVRVDDENSDDMLETFKEQI